MPYVPLEGQISEYCHRWMNKSSRVKFRSFSIFQKALNKSGCLRNVSCRNIRTALRECSLWPVSKIPRWVKSENLQGTFTTKC